MLRGDCCCLLHARGLDRNFARFHGRSTLRDASSCRQYCVPKMSRANSFELFLLWQKISARRALEVRLDNTAFPVGELSASEAEIAADVLPGGPETLAAGKAPFMRTGGIGNFEALTALSQHSFASSEARRGRSAFLDRG